MVMFVTMLAFPRRTAGYGHDVAALLKKSPQQSCGLFQSESLEVINRAGSSAWLGAHHEIHAYNLKLDQQQTVPLTPPSSHQNPSLAKALVGSTVRGIAVDK